MSKQTAVEWLIEQLNKEGFAPVVTQEEIDQAKAMERDQQGYTQMDLECAFFEGRENDLPFTEWIGLFKKR
jgi:hypothetical protein